MQDNPFPVRLLATMVQGGRSGIFRYVYELARRLEGDERVALSIDCLHDEEHLFQAMSHRRVAGRWDRGGVADLVRAQIRARAPRGGVLHVPSYRRVPWFTGKRVVATVHDLAPLHMPEKFGRARHAFLKHFVPLGLRRCAHILTVTDHTRRDIIERFGIDAGKITVTHNGIDHTRFQPGDRDSALTCAQRAIPQLSRDFVLYLARIEHPGKGHVPLLEAWALLRSRRRDLPQLVFAGAAVERSDEVFQRARDLGVDFLHTGYLDDDVIVALYQSCGLFVFPSLYEGFGLPPVEAMACGAPVASSRRAALAETAGPAAPLDPGDPESMAATLEALLDDSDERARLSQTGIEWSMLFDWDETARRTVDVYRAVVDRRG